MTRIKLLVGLAAAGVLYVVVRFVLGHLWWFAGPAAGLAVTVLAVTAGHLVRLDAAGRRNWALARWHRAGWKRTARNLRLAYVERLAANAGRSPKVNYPKVRFRADSSGWTVKVRTVHGVGRLELDAAAVHLADVWKCERVAVTQDRPGRLRVRAMRRDILLEQLALEAAPPVGGANPFQVWLGRDEHGSDRWLDLRNVSGVCVGGQPGGGKSQAITSWETQLASKPWAQFVNVDGKGAGEFDDFGSRAWITAGDSMDRMLAVLEMLTGLMYDRLALVRDFTGGRKNIWSVGVSADWPLQFSVFDETQSFFDLPAAKAMGKEHEKACAQAIKLASELVRKGRSVALASVFATQKPTSDSLPSAISSNCALSVAFSLKTLDAAKATLGADIGDYPSLSPVGLSLPDYAGVAVVSLRDGMNPFTRIRSPLVTEEQAATVAAASASLRRDPRECLPVTMPDDASELAEV